MSKVAKAQIKELKLNNSETAVMNSLESVPKRLIDIERKSGLPHSTVFDTLRSLENRNLVEAVAAGKRKLWGLALNKKNKDKNQINNYSNIEIYEGKEKVLSNIYSLFEQNKNKRVLVYHGPKAFSQWYKVLEENEVVNFNLLLQKLNIIVERFVPEKDFAVYMRNMSEQYKKSMLNRSQITYLLPDELFNSKTELILFNDSVAIYESHMPRLVVLKDKETLKMYQNIFEVFRTAGKKIDSQKEFLKFI